MFVCLSLDVYHVGRDTTENVHIEFEMCYRVCSYLQMGVVSLGIELDLIGAFLSLEPKVTNLNS